MGINDSEKSMNTGSTDEYKSLYDCLAGEHAGTGSIHDVVAKVNTPKLDDNKQVDEETISTEKENIIQFAIQKLIFKSKQCYVLTMRDITMWKNNAKLSEKNKVLNLMSSSVSHEMLTPLKCIVSIVDLLRKKKYSDVSITNNLEIVANTTHIVLNQIKNNLDNNLLETDHFQFRMDKFRMIADIVHPIVNIFRGQIKMQKLKVEVVYEHEDDPYVIVD